MLLSSLSSRSRTDRSFESPVRPSRTDYCHGINSSGSLHGNGAGRSPAGLSCMRKSLSTRLGGPRKMARAAGGSDIHGSHFAPLTPRGGGGASPQFHSPQGMGTPCRNQGADRRPIFTPRGEGPSGVMGSSTSLFSRAPVGVSRQIPTMLCESGALVAQGSVERISELSRVGTPKRGWGPKSLDASPIRVHFDADQASRPSVRSHASRDFTRASEIRGGWGGSHSDQFVARDAPHSDDPLNSPNSFPTADGDGEYTRPQVSSISAHHLTRIHKTLPREQPISPFPGRSSSRGDGAPNLDTQYPRHDSNSIPLTARHTVYAPGGGSPLHTSEGASAEGLEVAGSISSDETMAGVLGRISSVMRRKDERIAARKVALQLEVEQEEFDVARHSASKFVSGAMSVCCGVLPNELEESTQLQKMSSLPRLSAEGMDMVSALGATTPRVVLCGSPRSFCESESAAKDISEILLKSKCVVIPLWPEYAYCRIEVKGLL